MTAESSKVEQEIIAEKGVGAEQKDDINVGKLISEISKEGTIEAVVFSQRAVGLLEELRRLLEKQHEWAVSKPDLKHIKAKEEKDKKLKKLQDEEEEKRQAFERYEREAAIHKYPCNVVSVIKEGKQIEYHIPIYLAIVVKRIENFDFAKSSVDLVFTCVLRVQLSGVPEPLKACLQSLTMRFNNSVDVVFEKPKSRGDGILQYTARPEPISINFLPKLADFPFDLQHVTLRMEFSSVKVDPLRVIKFNFHINEKWGEMLSFDTDSNEFDKVVDFNVALGQIPLPRAQQTQSGPDATPTFPALVCEIPLYREPQFVLLNSFVPLFLLNVFTLGVFMIEPSEDAISDRLSVLITIVLAAFVFPGYRVQTPNLAQLTALDIYILLSVTGMLLAFVDSAVAALYGEVVLFRIILFSISVLAVMAIPFYAFYRYLRYHFLKHMYDKGSGASHGYLLTRQISVPNKVTRSAESFQESAWALNKYEPTPESNDKANSSLSHKDKQKEKYALLNSPSDSKTMGVHDSSII